MRVSIGRRQLELTNLDKVLYPKAGFTKAQVIDYYRRIAPAVLPHLRDRQLTLKRYPNGVEGEHFYEKTCPRYRPDWVKTDGKFCLAQDLPTLIWAANLADLELHTPLHRVPGSRPDMVVFDLDPGAPAGIRECCEVALLLRGLFDQLRLQAFPKTSGSKGIQVYVPLNTAGVTYEQTKAFARSVAETLEAQLPSLVVSNMKKSLRGGKVLVDWSQNDLNKTTVCVYSLRAKERPTVSTPLRWEEISEGGALRFETEDAVSRFEEHGDLFAPLLRLKQRLPAL